MQSIIKFLLILGIISGLYISYNIARWNHYGEVTFSDWKPAKDFPLDYSTNIVCYHQYSGRWCDIMRKDNYEDFRTRLERGDTLLIGMDYYALTGVSSFYFDRAWLVQQADSLMAGKVMVWQINKNFAKRLL
jgi:hypothetical protein